MKINVLVKLRAKKEEVVKIDETHYKIAVKVSPVEGKANNRIVELLAGYFKIPKSKFIIIFGLTSRNKIVEVML